MAQQQIKGSTGALGPSGTLEVYEVPGSATVEPLAVSAIFDGSGAAGDFLPCLTYRTITGAVIARCPAPGVAAGDTVEVSWFPGVAAQGAAIPKTVYLRIPGGGSGTWRIPSGFTECVATIVGAGGGGEGGTYISSGNPKLGGSAGAGGGARQEVLSLVQLKALYPAGVPYTIGAGGTGGVGRNDGTANDGGNGGSTTFAGMTAGGGSGGTAFPNAGGSSFHSSVPGTPGSPSAASGIAAIGGQAAVLVAQDSGGVPAEWGGATGGNGGDAGPVLGGGYAGGSSAFAGPGGGGGGDVSSANPYVAAGGKGGTHGAYQFGTAQATGSGAAGTFVGPYAGNGGDGGASSSTGVGASGGSGSYGAGGGGGGTAVSASPVFGGSGGSGGDGQIVLTLS